MTDGSDAYKNGREIKYWCGTCHKPYTSQEVVEWFKERERNFKVGDIVELGKMYDVKR